ncbi:MAG: PEP-utilizing enzyme [Desulfopila sp.]
MAAAIRRWWRGRTVSAAGEEINFWRLQALFNNFKRILQLNNGVLEEIATMERALGGEYIFDRAFLSSAVGRIARRVYHVTYSLNALTGNRHISLYDRYQEIRTLVDDILTNNIHGLTEEPVISLARIGWEHEPLVGMDLVCLAELGRHPWLAPVAGFAVSEEGIRALASRARTAAAGDDRLRPVVTDHLRRLVAACPADALSVVVTEVEGEDQPLRELDRFALCLDGAQLGAGVLRLMPMAPGVADPEKGNIDLLLDRLKQLAEAIVEKRSAGEDGRGRCALFIQAQPPCRVAGTIQTRPPAGHPLAAPAGLLARVVRPGDREEHHLLRRTHPFDLLESVVVESEDGDGAEDLAGAVDAGRVVGEPDGGFDRLELARLLSDLAETALFLERLYGVPLTVHWQVWADGVCRISGLRPQAVEPGAGRVESDAEPLEPTMLCQGGQTGQSGIGAGPVVHVDAGMAPERFPSGAVAVARGASPDLTPLLQRAAALVTEFGSSAGHLATVARELRLPSIFGLPSAMALLPEGVEVTVDGGQVTVYQGVVEELLSDDTLAMDLTPQDPEYRLLRRLLRFIQPLNLINPETQEFTAAKCRTFHDIIHFCHECAVDELAHFQERRPGLGALRTRSLVLGLPIDIRVLDIGGGLATADVGELRPGQIDSIPFRAYLVGLADPGAWNPETPGLATRDLFAGMSRTPDLMAASTDTLGVNLAIIGGEYLNLSLRMGYHFNVIDAYLGEDSSRNYVYFRFAGGLADPERRGRRARLIGRALAAMAFRTSIEGDLVVARLKLVEVDILQAALTALGALTAFTRQQDTNMHSEADVDRQFELFASRFLAAFSRSEAV